MARTVILRGLVGPARAPAAATAAFIFYLASSGGPAPWGAGLHVGAAILLNVAEPSARLMAYGWIVIAIAGLPWPAVVRGWPRVTGLLASLPLALIATAVPISDVTADAVNAGVSLGGAAGAPALLSGALPPALGAAIRLAAPFDGLIHLGLALLRCQLVIAFFKFLLLPVGLRRLSLRRRFAFNSTLTRSIPALLSMVLLAAVVYAGFTFHKAAQVRDYLDGTIERAEEAAVAPAGLDEPARSVSEARRSLGPDAAAASLVVRTSPGGSAVDVRLSANPAVYLAPVGVSIRASGQWTASPIALSVEAEPGRFSKGVLARKFPVGRLLVPAGDWRSPVEGGNGAVQVVLTGTLGQAIAAFERNPYLFSSNAVPVLFIGGVATLICIVEGLAVRTGRSIVSAVLDDIGRLRDGAQRIGNGHLDFRLPADGKDELSSLAGSLNAMAADLKRQQQQLLEKGRLEADLEVARSIQQRLLPQDPPRLAGLDVAGVSIPSRMVGGDLFYFLPFEGERLGIAIGDVSGKSAPDTILPYGSPPRGE